MKKKLMMVTLLLAGLSMGACVDDKESASVTAVRDAKTEQLESVAAMNSAAAEAKKAIAAAEAALTLAEAQAKQAAADLKNADAEYQKKQTELNALKNEAQTIENQKKQAELEAQLAQLEVDKKRIEKEMAQIKADMEKAQVEAQAALLRAEAAMKDAEQQLLNYEKQLADAKTQAEKDRIEAERNELEQLAYTYSYAVEILNQYKTNFNGTKSYLVYLENDLANTKEAKERLIAQYTNEITLLQMEIDALKKYANYTDDLPALQLQVTTLNAEKNRLRDIYNAATLAHNNYVVNTEASDALMAKVQKDPLYNLKNWALVDENGEYYYRSDGSQISTHWEVVSLLQFNQGFDGLLYSYEDGDYNYQAYIGDSLYVEIEREGDLRQFELGIEWFLNNYKTNLENATKSVTKLQRLYNGAATEADWEDGGSATKTCANMVDSTLILKAAYDKAAEADKATAKSAYETQLAKEQQCKQDLDAAINQQADAQLESDCFNKEVDIIRNFDTYNAALQAKIKARNEQVVKEYAEKVTLWMDSTKKYIEYSIAYDEWDVVSDILYGYYAQGANSIAAAIKAKEEQIAQKKADIDDISEIQDKEQMVEFYKGYLDIMSQLIAIQEINVQNAKADLEAAMAKYAATEE